MTGSSLLALAFCAFAAVQDKDPAQEQIDEFKKFYKPTKSTHERVEAIHVLDGLDRVSAAELLLAACGDKEFPVREAALQVLASYPGPEVRAFLREAAADDKRTKSGARSGAIQTLGALKDADSVPLLIKNLGAADFEVKRSSVVALGRIGAESAVDPILKLLADPEPALRTVALDALGLLRKPQACVPAILPLLEGPDWQVRASAIQALGKMRVKEAIPPLIAALSREEGRLREDAVAALRNTTASDFGEDAEGWQRWWDGVKDRFVVPTDEELAKRKEQMEKSAAQYAKKKEADFVGVPTKSRRIVFVIDTSGSMEDLIADTANLKFKDRAYASFMKMEIVKDELTRTIDALGPEVRFNILTFATEVKQWKSSLVPANLVNKAGAVKYISDLKPIGGASQGFNARAGLSGAAGMAGGKTNTYGALMTALDGTAAGAGPRGATTGADYDKSYASPIDTIYFLSDGVPSTGEYVEREEILAEVRRVNSLRKIVINTIAIGDMDHALMKMLAAQNYGSFVDLGR